MVAERLVTSSDAAVQAAADLGGTVVLKIASPDIVHKTELGAAALNLASEAQVREAFDDVTTRVRAARPEACINGVLASKMIDGGVETILGVQHDPTFGPVVMFGLGGVFVETLGDVSFRVAPFDENEAPRMIRETRGYAVLDGARGGPRYDIDALTAALAQLSVFASGHADDLESAELNPFVVLPEGQGAVALDALLVTRPI